MTKTLVLIRHAHRDNSHRELDNGLDEKGKEQAKAIKRFFGERFSTDDFKRGIWIVSSPKLRCIETLAPLAKSLDRQVDSNPDLDEEGPREGASGLEGRVQHFLREWQASKIALTVACSHGDWLPLAAQKLLGQAIEFKKGAWLELEADLGRTYLKWYVPSFKPFFK